MFPRWVSKCVSKRPLKFSSQRPCVFVYNISFRFNFTPAGDFLLHLRLLHFLFHCHTFLLIYPLLTITALRSHMSGGQLCLLLLFVCYCKKRKKKENKPKHFKFAPKMQQHTSHLTSLEHWGSELVQFHSSSLNLHHPVSCHTAVLTPHLFFFAACEPKLTFKATQTSKRIMFLFHSFPKRKKKNYKRSSFILSLLFSP